MRHAKVRALAAVATFALIALAAAEGAPATQICERVGSGGDGRCPGGSAERELAKGGSFTVSSTDAILTSATSEVSCSSSSVRLKMTSRNGISLVKGKVPALSFDGCETAGGTSCNVTFANLPYEAVLHPPDVLVSDPVGIAIHLDCGFLVSCQFTAQEQLLAVEGDLVVAAGDRAATVEGLCPVAARLDATYSASDAGSELTFSL
jgi:hypothetical protein